MTDKSNIIALMNSREMMYRFLGGLYLLEVDSDKLKALKNMTYPEISGNDDAELDLKEGYELLGEAASKLKDKDLDDLAADYAKVFLAAGEASGAAAFPYASVYLDRKHQVGGNMEQEMKKLYLARGLEPDKNMYRTMNDNVGLMFEYMAVLCKETAQAVEKSDEESVKCLMDEQKSFVSKNLTSWIYAFTGDIVKLADLDFYKGVARITSGFMKKEAAFFQEGDGSWFIV